MKLISFQANKIKLKTKLSQNSHRCRSFSFTQAFIEIPRFCYLVTKEAFSSKFEIRKVIEYFPNLPKTQTIIFIRRRELFILSILKKLRKNRKLYKSCTTRLIFKQKTFGLMIGLKENKGNKINVLNITLNINPIITKVVKSIEALRLELTN